MDLEPGSCAAASVPKVLIDEIKYIKNYMAAAKAMLTEAKKKEADIWLTLADMYDLDLDNYNYYLSTKTRSIQVSSRKY